MSALRVFILAGEPSGDKLGGALMAGLKSLRPAVVFEGIGGPHMQAEGLESRFDMAELSVMGLAEILPTSWTWAAAPPQRRLQKLSRSC